MRILSILAIVIIVAAVGWRYSRNNEPTSAPKNSPAVVAYTISIKPLVESLEAIGTAEASKAIDVTVTVSDVIATQNIQEGQKVAEGTILFELNKTEELALLSSANIELNQQLREYNRIEALVKQKSIPSSELDARQSNIDTAHARIAELTASIDNRTIRAPFAGVIGLRNFSRGALVKPGDIITTLDATELLNIDFELAEKYLTQVAPGKTIEASTSAYPDQKFSAQVATLDTRINPSTRSIKVRAVIENTSNQLRPGMLMTLKIIENEKLALLAPEEAVFMRASQHYVFVIDKALMVEERKVTLGTRKNGWIEVLAGLSEGEQIVHQGLLKVSQGTSVKIQNEAWRSEASQ